jgi:ABC-type transport system involved in multi-copper enzyme maturation permease subunit
MATDSTTSQALREAGHTRPWRALVWKSARESRARFWTSLGFLVLLVVYIVLSGPGFVAGYTRIHPEESLTYSEYIWQALFNYYLQGFWIATVLILGFGGILRERATGVAALTLGLPVSRSTVLWTRVAVGVGEAAALALVPTLMIPALSALAGRDYPIAQAAGFGFLLLAAGLVFFCYGILLSTIIESELTVPVVGLITVAAAFSVMKVKAVHRWSVFDVMNGAQSISPTTHFIDRPLPWLGITASVFASALLLIIAVNIVRRRDF